MRFCGLLPLFTSFIALNPLHACNKEYLKKLLDEDNSEKLTEKEKQEWVDTLEEERKMLKPTVPGVSDADSAFVLFILCSDWTP